VSELDSPIEELNEQLQELLNDWSSEISSVLRELADKRARVRELQSGFDKRGEKIASLKQQLIKKEAEFADEKANLPPVEDLKAEIESLRERLEDQQANLEAREKQLNAQQELIDFGEKSSKENVVLREQIASLEQRAGAQQDLIDAAEADSKEAALLKAETSTLQTHAATLRREVAGLEQEASSLRQEVARLRTQVAESESEAHTLRAETTVLQAESSDKEATIERLNSELASKQEIIRALRRDVDSERTGYQARDKEVARLKDDLGKSERITGELRAELQLMLDTDKEGGEDHTAEMQALRAELAARKAVIKSLRADAERFDALEARLGEKVEINSRLEESLSCHATTIADLKRSAENWRRKYQDLRLDASGQFPVEPAITETDIRAIEDLQRQGGAIPEHTIAIDMREPLAEARRGIPQKPDK